METVAAQIDRGFRTPEAGHLSEQILIMEIDDERVFEYKIAFRKKWSILQISVFMDDENSPDITFLGARQVIDVVSKALQEF